MDKVLYPHLDLRVDHHDNPVAMLRTLRKEALKTATEPFVKLCPGSWSCLPHPTAAPTESCVEARFKALSGPI